MVSADGYLWAVDRGTSKMLKYDLDGRLLYSWGTWGAFAGGFWGVHGISVDNEGNFYVAEVDAGRVQKFRPLPYADARFLVGAPAGPGALAR
jgi:sugar lactone lactonase YvrE